MRAARFFVIELQSALPIQNIFDIDGGLSHEVVRTRSAVYRLGGRAGDAWTLEFEPPAGLREARAMEDSFSGWARNVRTGERIATGAGSKNRSLRSAICRTATRLWTP